MDTKDYITLRVRKDTHKKLRVVSALSEERMLDTLDRLVAQEYARLHGPQKGRHDAALHKDQDWRLYNSLVLPHLSCSGNDPENYAMEDWH